MRQLALILVVSHLALGCTVVVDARPKNPQPDDIGLSDAPETDISGDAEADMSSSDTVEDADSDAEDSGTLDIAPIDATLDVTTSDLADIPPEDDAATNVEVDVEDDVPSPPDVPVTNDYLLETADDVLMNDGTTGTLVVKKEHAIVFPVDLTVPQKNVLALTPDTLLEKFLEFSCLGNANVENFFNDTTQKGPGSTLKLLEGNPISGKLEEGSKVSLKEMATVVTVEMELPYEVPQSDFTYEPGTLCFGVYNQGDWYFSFEPVQVQLDPLAKKGVGVLTIDFPAKVEAVAVLTGQNIAINWIRYTVND